MAHFAKIVNGIVETVIVVSNEDLQKKEFPESESIGQQFLKSVGLDGEWLQTSYNGKFRQRYAGIGYSYNAEMDAFISPQPYASWNLDKTTGEWMPPKPFPNDDPFYFWDENTSSWVK
jgi:hypothetical protein